MIHQPEVRLLICVSFYCCQSVIDRMENTSKSDVVRWQGNDVMMEPMVVEEVKGVIKGCCDVEGRRSYVVCMWLKGP